MKINKRLVEAVGTLLCQSDATHPEFFSQLSIWMSDHGYTLEAHQQGIRGTHITITHYMEKVEDK